MFIKDRNSISLNLHKLEEKSHLKLVSKLIKDPTRKFRKLETLDKDKMVSQIYNEM